jgi:hypothetical protein
MFAARNAILTRPTTVVKANIAYGNPFTALPPGNNLAMTTGAAATGHTIISGILRESNSTISDGQKYSAYVLSDVLNTDVFEVTAGNAALSTTDRGIGPGVFNSDMTKGVFVIISGNTHNCRIHTWNAGVVTIVGTTSGSFSTSSSDIIKLIPTINAGVVTWNVYRNATLLGANWVDSTHIMDIPGHRPAGCFRRLYSNGHFASPGIKSLSAVDL